MPVLPFNRLAFVEEFYLPVSKKEKSMVTIPFGSVFSGIDYGSSVSKQEEQVSEEKSNPDTVKSASVESPLSEEGRLDWNIDNPNSIMEACYKFLSMRKAGYTFYRLVGEDGSKLLVYDFDQNYPNIHFVKNKNDAERRIGIKISL